MMKNFHDMKKKSYLRDISAEQGMLGGALGIVECFRMDLLKRALKWVDKNGCVSDYTTEHKNIVRSKRQDKLIGKSFFICSLVYLTIFHLPLYTSYIYKL